VCEFTFNPNPLLGSKLKYRNRIEMNAFSTNSRKKRRTDPLIKICSCIFVAYAFFLVWLSRENVEAGEYLVDAITKKGTMTSYAFSPIVSETVNINSNTIKDHNEVFDLS